MADWLVVVAIVLIVAFVVLMPLSLARAAALGDVMSDRFAKERLERKSLRAESEGGVAGPPDHLARSRNTGEPDLVKSPMSSLCAGHEGCCLHHQTVGESS
ncbi:MAG: hypothetical protein LKI98_05515 [Bifidobacterium crudilactis]|jgi:hypothetical protein|nr:hypothetical protein [Bifidobacterium crudilactis]MCI1889879.1 hypothetical protein [Bifidobacterium crudilactis]